MTKLRTVPFSVGHWDFFKQKDPREGLLSDLCEGIQDNRMAIASIISDTEVVAICGGNYLRRGVMEVWMFPSINIAKYSLGVVKALKKLIGKYMDNDVYKVQMATEEGQEHLRKWAVVLGFKEEGFCPYYSPDGKGHHMYGISKWQREQQQQQ